MNIFHGLLSVAFCTGLSSAPDSATLHVSNITLDFPCPNLQTLKRTRAMTNAPPGSAYPNAFHIFIIAASVLSIHLHTAHRLRMKYESELYLWHLALFLLKYGPSSPSLRERSPCAL